MIQLTDHGMYLVNGVPQETAATDREEARRRTMAWQILQAHNESPDPMQLRIRFDAMVSHDITYVGIIQQARASGMKEFPIPYALTNCHNSLCAVGGTINEDDHMFGLSAAKKYGGIYVPANQSVIHSYAREQMAKCGSMILGSDSHTRYGALGTMAVGEGGPELAKQLLKNTWDTPHAQGGAGVSHRQAPAGHRPSRRGHCPGEGHLRKRLCQQLRAGVRRPRHQEPAHRLPQRHRRDDHRDHLSFLHLGDRRGHPGLL